MGVGGGGVERMAPERRDERYLCDDRQRDTSCTPGGAEHCSPDFTEGLEEKLFSFIFFNIGFAM